MRTFLKISAVFVAAAMLAIIAVGIFAKIFITPQRVRDTVLPVAEQALNRDVQLDDITIGFFSGITLHNLSIKKRNSDEIFISSSRASLRYRLLPLLFLQVVIDEIRFEEPRIHIDRRADGTFDFDDLLETRNDSEPVQQAPAPSSSESTAPPINLTVATVNLSKGTVLFTDAFVNPDNPARHTISNLNANASSITLDEAFPFAVSCTINGASLDLAGRADISSQDIRAEIELQDLDATTYVPYAAGAIPGDLTSLNAALSAQVHANPQQILAEGALKLHAIDLVLDALPDAPIRQARVRLDFDLGADLAESQLQITSLRLDYNGFIAEAGGKIEHLDTTPHVSLDLQTSELNLDKLLGTASSAAGKEPGPKSSQKHFEANEPDQELGPFDLPVAANGTIKIARLVYKGLPINNFSLAYRLADSVLTIEEMTGQTAEGSFSQSAHIDLGQKGLAYQGTLNVENLQLDPVVSAFIPQATETLFGSLAAGVDFDGRGTLPQSIKQNLTCTLKMNLDQGRISGSKLSRGLAEFLNVDELRDLDFNSFSGTVNIRQGRALLDTTLDSDRVRMSPRGALGLDGVLDLNLTTFLSPELLKKLDKKAKVTQYLTDRDGWGRLPLLLQGSLKTPRFSLDAGNLIKQTEQTVLETLQDKLLEKIQEADQDSDNMTEEEKQAKKQRKKERKEERKKRKAAKKAAKQKKTTESTQ